MTNHFEPFAAAAGRCRSPWLIWLTGFVLMAFVMTTSAQAPPAQPQAAGQYDGLVGPIALYPDDLVSIVLPASTNPLQIVQADRFLDKRKTEPKLEVDANWDDSVKSLLNYPDVVKMMSNDLDWTSALGEAVVSDQGAVLDAIQSFRRRAQAAGNLKSDGKQVVQAEQEVITIVPADPQVIYVPQYNPTTVVTYGVAPVYGYYPTPYPSYYYPYAPGAALAAGVIWGAAIGAAWNGNRYGANYGGNANINVNRNTNINASNVNTANINRSGGAGAQAGGGAWKSNKQPGQVSSSVGKTNASARVGDARAGAGAAGTNRAGAAGGAGAGAAGGLGGGAGAGGAGGFGGAAAGGAARPSTQPGGAGATRGGGSGGNAFGDYGSGRQTQMDSSRGASSRGSASGARSAPSSGARSAPGGGGARSSGGGGGARGGGGGGGGRGGGGRR